MRQTVFPTFGDISGKRVLIALSGGADSVALTLLLSKARLKQRLTLFAAHVDHAIRSESAEDADFCKSLCEKLDIPFFSERFDVPAEAAQSGEGLETCARRLRYDYLRKIRSECNADCIALAHHADDQAETVLMHLLRGTGPSGITGMATFSDDLYRPLLQVRKADLTAYLKACGQPWREDRTNQIDDNPRNALRLKVLPELESIYPGAANAIVRYAESARLESDYISDQTLAFLKTHFREYPFGIAIDWREPPAPAIIRRVLQNLTQPDHSTLLALEALCRQKRGRVNAFEKTPTALYRIDCQPRFGEVPFSLQDKTILHGLCSIEAAPASPIPLRDNPFAQVLRQEALAGCVLRTRRVGDRIRPLGCGEKLLSDYFTDKHVDRPLRDCVPLLARDDQILWAVGLGISETAALQSSRDPAVKLTAFINYNEVQNL